MSIQAAPVLPGGKSVRYLDFGVGPQTLVFIHGYGASSIPYFAEFCAQPSLHPVRKILIDLPGFGLSDRPESYGYGFEDFAQCVAEVLEHAGVEQFDLLGHSMGGAVAILLAARLAGRLRKLILVEPNLDATGSEVVRCAREGLTGSEGVQRRRELEALAGEFWSSTLRLASAEALQGAAASFATPRNPKLTDLLNGITAPRLVLLGEESEFDRLPLQRLQADVRIIDVARAGHNVMLDNPGEFADRTLSFLSYVP
ncbi:alpha/beta fold hydrolase [Psychromicrobium lacuslunae]|uniref:alpha/beta fold hydrolase n=1 Tax=Psychromicrobium lacuslunae TaxID=1618207 RepID=UPI000695E85D|nr:alpha/beta hydrolase [Psychromicrobium lacuslunae]